MYFFFTMYKFFVDTKNINCQEKSQDHLASLKRKRKGATTDVF
jgi:hypothetical protein